MKGVRGLNKITHIKPSESVTGQSPRSTLSQHYITSHGCHSNRMRGTLWEKQIGKMNQSKIEHWKISFRNKTQTVFKPILFLGQFQMSHFSLVWYRSKFIQKHFLPRNPLVCYSIEHSGLFTLCLKNIGMNNSNCLARNRQKLPWWSIKIVNKLFILKYSKYIQTNIQMSSSYCLGPYICLLLHFMGPYIEHLTHPVDIK